MKLRWQELALLCVLTALATCFCITSSETLTLFQVQLIQEALGECDSYLMHPALLFTCQDSPLFPRSYRAKVIQQSMMTTEVGVQESSEE